LNFEYIILAPQKLFVKIRHYGTRHDN